MDCATTRSGGALVRTSSRIAVPGTNQGRNLSVHGIRRKFNVPATLLLISANEIDDNSLRFSVFSSGHLDSEEELMANMYIQIKLRRTVLAVMCVLFIGAFASAQITSVTSDQAPPIPGVGHDYIGLINETVSPSNGALSIRINLATPGGRGISLPFSIGYDSNAAHHILGDALSRCGRQLQLFGTWRLELRSATVKYAGKR